MNDIFFTNSQQSKINLLKYLHFCQLSCSVEGAANYFNLSTRTIERQVAELKNDFEIIFSKKQFDLSIKRGTIILEVANNLSLGYAIECLRVSYVEHSIEHTLIKLLLTTKYDSVLDLADVTFQSPSSIYKHLDPIKNLLELFNIQISFVDNSGDLNLIYHEKNLRYFIYYFYWTRLKGIKQPYPEILADIQLNEGNSPAIYANLLPSKKQQIDYLISITFNRMKSGQNFLIMNSDFAQILTVFYDVNDLSRHLPYSFEKIPQEKRHNERLFYNFLLRSVVSELDSDQEKKAIVTALSNIDSPVVGYVDGLIETISHEYQIFLPIEEAYLLWYYTTIYFMFVFFLEITPPLHLFTTDFSENSEVSPELKEKIVTFYHAFEKNHNLPKTINHDEFIVMMINYMLRFKQLNPLKIAIQFSKNIVGEITIKERIRLMFNQDMIIFTTNHSEADVILSDCHETNDTQENYFLIEKINDNLIWHGLLEYIQQQIFKKNWLLEHTKIKNMT